MAVEPASAAPAAAAWPWLAAPLADALKTQHGHALLLHGPSGAVQFELGMQLAGAWLCEAGPTEGPRSAACGRCAGCKLLAARSHPDLLVLVPEILRESLGWEAGEGGDSPGEGSGTGKTKPSKEIKVGALRQGIAFAQTTASRGRAKVLLLYPAERINTIAANTLLKTLEEPPGATRFILATAAVDSLLPTIRSRCQTFLVAAPPAEVALAWLRERQIPDAEAALAAAGGQPQEVVGRIAEGIDASAWRQLPGWLQQGRLQPLAAWPLPRLVDALQKLCHDLMCCAVGAPPRYFAAAELPAPPQLGALAGWQRELQRVAEQIEHPLSAPLLLDALVLRAQQVLRPSDGVEGGTTANTRHPSLHWAR